MPTTSQLRLPPILDENLFEDFCCDLWAIIWNDPDAERNGRKGQSQCGVDVFGLPAKENRHQGVQCKAYGRPLTNVEIQHEIDEAKKFTPPLRKLIIACTGPRDATGQTYVRQINLDHRTAKLFSVSILGWEDIKGLVQKHFAGTRPDLVEKYFELTTTSGSLAACISEAIENTLARTGSNGMSAVARMEPLPAIVNQEHYHSELNYARSLVNQAKPEQALEYLAECRARVWHDAKPPLRYRLLHYEGCANYQLERMPEAGRLLVEALQYNPEDEIALAFAALGYLILGDKENAASHARQALTRNPSNGKAYATLIRTLDQNLPFDSLLETVPSAYRNLPEAAIAFTYLAREKGLLPEAEKWCRLAIEQDRENWADLYGILGEILMQQALADGPILPEFQISAMKREQLEGAVEAFGRAWNQIRNTDIKRNRISWLSNRSAAHLMLGRPAEATEDLDAAIRLDEDPLLILRRANLAAQEGETAQAIALLHRVRPSADQVEPCLMLAELLTGVGRHDEAERTLDQLAPNRLSEMASLSAERIRLRIEIERRDWPKAQDRFAELRAAHPESIDVLADGAWLWRLAGDSQASLALLAEATSRLDANGSPAQLHTLAMEWYENGEYREAARLYERIADRGSDGPLTRRLLVCLYYEANLSQALGLAQHMLSLHGPLPTVSSIAVAILDEAGDLANARRVAEEYLHLFPADFEMRLRLASVLQRLGDAAGVDAFLDTPIALNSLTMSMALRVASLHAYRGRMERALNIAYEVRRKHADESQAHLFYVSLFFNARNSDQEDEADTLSVSLDTAVCIRDESGKEEWHVIDERDDRIMPLELAPDHPLSRKLMGLGVGAEFPLNENEFSTETATVTIVQSKFVYALQESMRTYERMFPDEPGLWNVRLPLTGDDPAVAEPDLDPVFRMITRRHERFLNVERLYCEGQIPLAMAAQLTGQNIIQTWSMAVAKPEFGIRCSQGTPGEMESARHYVESGTSVVLEPVSLLTLYGLKTRDVLVRRFGKFAVPQSLIDMIQRARQECIGIASSGSMTVGMEGDQLVRDEITPEHVQGNLAYLDGLLAWVGENCAVTPISSALVRSRDFRSRIKDMMDACFIDSILIASEEGRIFYCDDERLRALAKGEADANGVWTQVLLAMSLDEDLIDTDAYSDAIIRLLSSNYRHIFVNPGIFLVAARKAGWRPTHPFSVVTGVLSGTKSDLASAVTIAGEAMYGIWKEPLMDHQRSFLVTEILNGLSVARDRSAVLTALIPVLQKRFYLLPFQYRDIRRLIDGWASLHLL